MQSAFPDKIGWFFIMQYRLAENSFELAFRIIGREFPYPFPKNDLVSRGFCRYGIPDDGGNDSHEKRISALHNFVQGPRDSPTLIFPFYMGINEKPVTPFMGRRLGPPLFERLIGASEVGQEKGRMLCIKQFRIKQVDPWTLPQQRTWPIITPSSETTRRFTAIISYGKTFFKLFSPWKDMLGDELFKKSIAYLYGTNWHGKTPYSMGLLQLDDQRIG